MKVYGKPWSKTTYYDNRAKWENEISQAERDRALKAGRTHDGVWSTLRADSKSSSAGPSNCAYKAKVRRLRQQCKVESEAKESGSIDDDSREWASSDGDNTNLSDS